MALTEKELLLLDCFMCSDIAPQSQRDAVDFINSLPYNDIDVTGHSKGGNKAM